MEGEEEAPKEAPDVVVASDVAPSAEPADDAGAEGQLVVHGETLPPPPKRKRLNLLNRSPSPVYLEDYGDLDPARCTVHGPGVAGGIVGVPTQVLVTARDAKGVGIREGGQTFTLSFQHYGKGSVPKTYQSVDHGDGHYTISGVRADLRGMHELSVEVGGSLVGDSPYLVMFEVDDQPPAGQGFDGDMLTMTTKTSSSDVKERIVFVQHMAPDTEEAKMQQFYDRFGKLIKCERLLPAQDIWILQYLKAKDAQEALTTNQTAVLGSTPAVSLASHMGGVGTHPLIIRQLQHIQSLQIQEQQSVGLATMLAQQRAAIRQSGGEVEELTDTRKKHKAVALMQRLRAKAAQAAGLAGDGRPEPAAEGGRDRDAEASPKRPRDARGDAGERRRDSGHRGDRDAQDESPRHRGIRDERRPEGRRDERGGSRRGTDDGRGARRDKSPREGEGRGRADERGSRRSDDRRGGGRRDAGRDRERRRDREAEPSRDKERERERPRDRDRQRERSRDRERPREGRDRPRDHDNSEHGKGSRKDGEGRNGEAGRGADRTPVGKGDAS